jgi:hypothetical protein
MLTLQGLLHAQAAALLPGGLGGVGREAGPGLGLGVAGKAGQEVQGGRWSPPCVMGRYGARLPTWG